MRTAREVVLPLTLDRGSADPLPAQLSRGFRELLAAGILTPGDPLPATRALAEHLGVSRGTVVAAYEQLLAEGWFVASGGRDTRVNPKLRAVRPAQAFVAPAPESPSCTPDLIDLRPGRPHQASIAGAEWRSAWRRAADESLDVPELLLGWPPLRTAIAEHLRRMRALVRDPGHIAITAGGREGLALLLKAAGIRSVGVEDPGFPSLRRVIEAAGAEVRSLPTDERGLVTDSLPEDPPDMVLVTPSHQYPLGGSLPIDRRQQLLDWAGRHGVWVVEDDYDSELRYTSEPLPALTAMDVDGRVALLGTFSKTLTPALATGFVVLPHGLVPEVTRIRAELGMPVSLVTQRALAYFLDSGALSRHTQRMRQIYRRRRRVVVDAFRDVPGIAVHPMDGGLHAVIEFDGDEAAVVDRLAALGVGVGRLSAYWSGADGRSGLVFGFGAVDDAELRRGLAAIIASME